MKITKLLLVILILIISCTKKDDQVLPDGMEERFLKVQNMITTPDGLSESKATMKTVYGNIVFKFYPKKAPLTITRIIELIEQGFYDGLKFHRVVPNFVVQLGDPTGTGSGGSGQKLKAEFNDIQHIRGTVAMARTVDENSADSQFYIALTTLPHLDQRYTVFAQVVEGLDILSKISQGDKVLSLTFTP